ncbi:hypothetical protein EVAR_15820_1 [Eumeta japonica]|uniref:Uncharacterized protein n=1 Tax=Eumeta variegata TaxID=151549 RepID=A0A4C1TZQ7_EUMVA|nr:hypothetical protein EVAR_15820_1 [Eumeta japonica]
MQRKGSEMDLRCERCWPQLGFSKLIRPRLIKNKRSGGACEGSTAEGPTRSPINLAPLSVRTSVCRNRLVPERINETGATLAEFEIYTRIDRRRSPPRGCRLEISIL